MSKRNSSGKSDIILMENFHNHSIANILVNQDYEKITPLEDISLTFDYIEEAKATTFLVEGDPNKLYKLSKASTISNKTIVFVDTVVDSSSTLQFNNSLIYGLRLAKSDTLIAFNSFISEAEISENGSTTVSNSTFYNSKLFGGHYSITGCKLFNSSFINVGVFDTTETRITGSSIEFIKGKEVISRLKNTNISNTSLTIYSSMRYPRVLFEDVDMSTSKVITDVVTEEPFAARFKNSFVSSTEFSVSNTTKSAFYAKIYELNYTTFVGNKINIHPIQSLNILYNDISGCVFELRCSQFVENEAYTFNYKDTKLNLLSLAQDTDEVFYYPNELTGNIFNININPILETSLFSLISRDGQTYGKNIDYFYEEYPDEFYLLIAEVASVNKHSVIIPSKNKSADFSFLIDSTLQGTDIETKVVHVGSDFADDYIEIFFDKDIPELKELVLTRRYLNELI